LDIKEISKKSQNLTAFMHYTGAQQCIAFDTNFTGSRDFQINNLKGKTMEDQIMTSEKRVEAFQQELGLILRKILGLDQDEQVQLPQVVEEDPASDKNEPTA
jgi:hypothetical protein